MPKGQRSRRLNEEFLREISQIVREEIGDPRVVDLTSILRVEVTQDLSYAKVYVSIYGEAEVQKKAMDALEQAKGFIRTELAKRLPLRKVPSLRFLMDDSIAYAIQMSRLIDEVIENDRHDE